MKAKAESLIKFLDGANKRLIIPVYQRNYDWQIKQCQQLYNAISRLEIIDIFLQENDNPQLIFESLNVTGLVLEEGDKIRNYILMDLPALTQEINYQYNKLKVF